MTLDEMAYQFFDTGWFDPNDRPKTALAMQHLIERVPDDCLRHARCAGVRARSSSLRTGVSGNTAV